MTVHILSTSHRAGSGCTRVGISSYQGPHEELKAGQSKALDIARAEQNRACAISLILTLAQVRSFSGATSTTFRLASLTKDLDPVSSKNLEVC